MSLPPVTPIPRALGVMDLTADHSATLNRDKVDHVVIGPANHTVFDHDIRRLIDLDRFVRLTISVRECRPLIVK